MPVIRREIRTEDIGFVNMAFDHYASNKGYLTAEEFKLAAIVIYGRKLLKEEKARLVNTGDVTIDNSLKPAFSREKFLELMLSHLVTTRVEEDVRAMFMAMDRKCRGYLVVDDLKAAFSAAAPHIAHSRMAVEAFNALDADGDGRVTYRDFEFIMACNLDV